jgi:hypothetical protein
MFRKLHELGPEAVTVFIDGRSVAAEPGESVAAVLLRQAGGLEPDHVSLREPARTLLHDGRLFRMPDRG